MNRGFCNTCQNLAPATPMERDGKMYLVKDCPDCGTTETLIASDAERYENKRGLDTGYDYIDCRLGCLDCKHVNKPNIVFVDITNRCNMNCPICINNTPSMGFLFEPPIEYFDKIFEHFSHYDPRPSLQLFGGEPTVRDDLVDIVRMAKSYRLSARVVTNGIKLANEDYCRRLVERRATILIAYDGANPEVYRVLRGNAKYLELKQKAIENIRKIPRAKVVLMSLIGKGFNDQDVPELFRYVHERRDFIRGIYFLPLAHTWEKKDFDLEPERITSDDIERVVDNIFPGERVEFFPAGFLGQLPNIMKYLKVKPLPFMGAHPSCESMYLLVSNGKEYVPVAWYFKGSVIALAHDLLKAEKKLAQRLRGLETGPFGGFLGAVGLKTFYLRLRAGLSVGRILLRRARVGRFFKGNWPAKLFNMLAFPLRLAMGTRSKTVLACHTTAESTLQIIVLPFEDPHTLETERMERCPSAFAFYDPRTDEVKTVPVCAWGLHKVETMRMVSDFYKTRTPVRTANPT